MKREYLIFKFDTEDAGFSAGWQPGFYAARITLGVKNLDFLSGNFCDIDIFELILQIKNQVISR